MLETREVVVCVFYDPEAARDAVHDLRDAGFGGDDVSFLSPEREEDRRERARKGAVTGVVAGGLFGGLAGWLIGLGTMVIPGVGPFISAGALATALGGALVGAGVGAIAGSLVGMGVPEKEAKYYEQEVRNGRSLVAVRAGKRGDQADRIMHGHGGYDVQHPERSTTIPVR